MMVMRNVQKQMKPPIVCLSGRFGIDPQRRVQVMTEQEKALALALFCSSPGQQVMRELSEALQGLRQAKYL